MTRVILNFWNREWQTVSYDTDTGRGRVRWFGRKPERMNGWAHRRSGRWFVLRSEGDALFFQSGTQSWRVGDEVKCRLQEEDKVRRFALVRHGAVEFELEYRVKVPHQDPTFDDLDDEMQDFFLWLNRLWCDPSRQADLLSSTFAAATSPTGQTP